MANGTTLTRRLGDYQIPDWSPSTDGLSGDELPGFEAPLGLPTLVGAAIINTVTVPLPYRIKSFALLVTTALAWTTAGQPSVQVYVSRKRQPASTGALAANGTDSAAATYGSTANLGGAGITGLAANLYYFSPAQLPELQWWQPQVGIQLTFPSNINSGAMLCWFEIGGF